MKKIYFAGMIVLCGGNAMAQSSSYVTPIVLDGVYAQKISPNGEYLMVQDFIGSSRVLKISTEQYSYYDACYPGNGNCITNDGTLVGQTVDTSQAVIMKEGKITVPESLKPIPMSSLDAITPNGKRACGWMMNPNDRGADYVPYYIDINPDGTTQNPKLLPAPQKDFFGDKPQFCNAVCISDDGKTIGGYVQDASGFFSYPVIYTQTADGSWNCSTPTEKTFNTEKLPIPKFPADNVGYSPQMYDFMSPDKQQEWRDAVKKFEITGDEKDNPMNNISYYITDEEYEKFEEALKEYQKKLQEYYRAIDLYWDTMNRIGKNQRYGGYMSISPDGKILCTDLGISNNEELSDNMDGYVPYMFHTEDDTFEALQTNTSDLLITQIMYDGTLIAVTSPNAFFPYTAYIKTKDSADFIPFTDYILETNPSFFPWIEDNLGQFGVIGYDPETGEPINGFYIITGWLSFNQDMTIMAGGLPIGDFMSYIYTGAKSEINEILEENNIEASYEVFKLNGMKILSTKEKALIRSLPAGIYIINGKKVKI